MTSTAQSTRVAETGPERVADRMYHDLLSPPEILRVRERVWTFADRAVAPIAGRIANGDERLDGFPRDAFEAMATSRPRRSRGRPSPRAPIANRPSTDG